MKKPGIILLGILFLTGGLSMATAAMADSDDPMPRAHHHERHGEFKAHGGHHAGKMEHRGYGAKHHSWRHDLSDEQRKDIDKLKLAYKKESYLVKSKIKQAKVEFAILITEDSPNQSAFNKKIDQISKLNAEKLRLKASYKIKVRKILTPDQRVNFDMEVLKKSFKGKGNKGHN